MLQTEKAYRPTMANMFLIWAPALMQTLTGINLNLYMYHYLFSQITLLYFIVYDDKCANSRLPESEIITFMPWPKPCDFRLHTVTMSGHQTPVPTVTICP